MHNRYTTLLLTLLMTGIISSCDVFNDNPSQANDFLTLNSSIASNVEAVDVVQNRSRVYIFGRAENKDTKDQDFYLAEIDTRGNLLWEKMYGSNETEVAFTMIETSDTGLLLVGGRFGDVDGQNMYVIKVDDTGKLIWENTYGYDLDKVGFGNNTGRAVTEVADGYIIGGQGSISERNQGRYVPALTKIDFNGNKIWSKAASYSGHGNFYGLQSNESGTQFVGTGVLPNADFIIFNTQNADTVQLIDRTHSNDHLLNITRIGDSYFAPGSGSFQLELFGISETENTFFSNKNDEFEHQFASNIDGFTDFTITTGHTSDGSFGNPIVDLYAVKNAQDLSTVWTFVYSTEDTKEKAAGAYKLPDSHTGIVANRYTNNRSTIILLQVNENGNLKTF